MYDRCDPDLVRRQPRWQPADHIWIDRRTARIGWSRPAADGEPMRRGSAGTLLKPSLVALFTVEDLRATASALLAGFRCGRRPVGRSPARRTTAPARASASGS